MRITLAFRQSIRLLVFGWVCSALGAVDHYVASQGAHVAPFLNWEQAATNIQDALNAAGPGEVVWVTNGVYRLGQMLQCTNSVVLRSVNGRDAVALDGNYPTLTSNAVFLNRGTLDGFTITNAGGHGVKCEFGAVVNCRVTGAWGNGIDSATAPRVNTNATLIVTNTLVDNSGAAGVASAAVNTVLDHCEVTRSAGCGILLVHADSTGTSLLPRMTNALVRACHVSENQDSGIGCAVYWYVAAKPTIPMLIEDCVIENNVGSRGGGISDSWGTGLDGSSGVQVRNCTIRNNRATGTGGGVFFLNNNRAPAMINSFLSGNVASNYGGGAYLGGGTLRNCTLIGNTAALAGGLYAASGSILNSIVYHNAARSSENSSGGSFGYCCTTPARAGTGNITNAPYVVGPSNAHVVTGSACIDAGNIVYAEGDFDFDGEPRIWGNNVDIGCDEYYDAGLTGAITAAISMDYNKAVAPSPLQFVARMNGKLEGFVWEWGDGQSMTNIFGPAHAYSLPGDYPVLLTAWNKSMSTSLTAMVYVYPGYTNYVAVDGPGLWPFTNWAMAAGDIQAAVNDNIPGGVVVVSNGIYALGEATVGNLRARVYVPVALAVQSVNGPDRTVIMGAGPVGTSAIRCAYLEAGARLLGFTLTNGHTLVDSLIGDEINGGGAWCQGGASLSNCVVTGCAAGQHGGGVSGGTLKQCALVGNVAGVNGGGASSVTALVCEVRANTALADGGGLHGSVARKCRILDNTACSEGGGAYAGLLENCLVVSNLADYGGGATWTTNIHCTIVANQAATLGGGVYKCNHLNSIVYFNHALQGWDNYFNSICRYTCTTPDPQAEGSLTNAPNLWLAGPAAYHLQPDSPCLDVGLPGLAAIDLDGAPRPLAGRLGGAPGYDLGAYEYGPVQYVATNGGAAWPYTAWAMAARDIQSAVDAGAGGCLVLVSNGVYAGGGRSLGSGPTNRVTVTNAVTVASVHGPVATRIVGQGPAGDAAIRCVYLGPGAVMAGFVITNGHTLTNGDPVLAQSGGGVWADGTALISNCVVSGNSAADAGGGAYQGRIVNSLLVGNRADRGGGAASANLLHCTVAANSAVLGGGLSAAVATNCVVYFNSGGNVTNSEFSYGCTTPAATGPGNLTNDPQFAGFAAGDYRLLADSPAIDAGVSNSLAVDFNGLPRPLDGNNDGVSGWDMGPYEVMNPLADSDHDRLTDTNEWYGIGTDPSRADTDGDFMGDGAEVIAGTNPLNSNSFFAIREVAAVQNGRPVVLWNGVAGRFYAVYAADTPTGVWTNLATNLAGASSMTWTNTDNPDRRIFRLGVRRP